jgi:hypothetical protein
MKTIEQPGASVVNDGDELEYRHHIPGKGRPLPPSEMAEFGGLAVPGAEAVAAPITEAARPGTLRPEQAEARRGTASTMWVFGDADTGKKNIVAGIALFVMLGIGLGVPLTIDFFGGTTLGDGYATWKVVHGYAVFLSFINYFFGLTVDRLSLTRTQKEVAGWSVLAAGLFGGVGRPALVLMSALEEYGIWVSLSETAFLIIGTIVFVIGQIRGRFLAGKQAAQQGRDATLYGSPAQPWNSQQGRLNDVR